MKSCPLSGTRTRRAGPFLVPLLLALGVASLAAVTVRAQAPTEGVSAAAPSLVVESKPMGAVVTLRGPYTWTGQTPWTLDRDATGSYEVEAAYPGYETWRGDLTLGGAGTKRLTINLSRRTALKAAMRNVLVPGWGQFYSKSPAKGSVFLGLFAAGLTGVAWTEIQYENRRNHFEDARAEYERARRLGVEWDALYRKTEDASNWADAAYRTRNVWIAATGAVYGLAILDALLFFPNEQGASLSRPVPNASLQLGGGLGLSADLQPQSARVGLTRRW